MRLLILVLAIILGLGLFSGVNPASAGTSSGEFPGALIAKQDKDNGNGKDKKKGYEKDKGKKNQNAQGVSPRILNVTHSPGKTLHPGDVLTVNMRGDRGGQASFDIFGVVHGIPMKELTAGRYRGTVRIPDVTQGVRNAAVLGRLSVNGRINIRTSHRGVDIQAGTLAADIKVYPGDGENVYTSRPNVLAVFSGSGASAISRSTIRLALNGVDVTHQSTTSVSSISYVPQSDLPSGRNTAAVIASNAQGSQVRKEWSFSVGYGGASGSEYIRSVTHDAYGPLRSGQTLTVTMEGEPNGQAYYDIGTYRQRLGMNEVSSGRYIGRYSVAAGDYVTNAFVVAYLTAPGRAASSLQATTPVSFMGTVGAATLLRFTSPVQGDTVSDTFDIAGYASPYAVIGISVKLNLGGMIPLQSNVLSADVRADETGHFRYPFNGYVPVRGGTYTITATAKSVHGQLSESVSVTVSRR